MFPMVTGLADLRVARQLLADVQQELVHEGIAVGDIAVGVMIEVPSAALCADQLARECDFFSIGTNDLAQYTLACDRTNARVAHLLDPLHPAVLQLIARTIDSGRRAGIHVGMCGELAADPVAVPILLGLGLQEFSVGPSAIPTIKKLLAQLTLDRAQGVADGALEIATTDAVRDFAASALQSLETPLMVEVTSGG